jgi:molybdopterin/thiamine biosynthesis adenylyltransferase
MGDTENRQVLIVGLGGLGAPAALALARSGIAEIAGLALVDPDPVELSNLPRQILYRDADIGTYKVIAAERRLHEIDSRLRLAIYAKRLDAANASDLIGRASFVIDATDDPFTKFLINDACIASRTPFVYGGAIMLTGQAMTVLPAQTACLRCLFEGPPDADEAESCRDAGILGPVAGAIGEAQAAEASSWLRGARPALAGRILTYDATRASLRVREIAARAGCVCGAATAGASALRGVGLRHN